MIVPVMSTQLNAFVAGLYVPTQFEDDGEKTTSPFEATAAPENLLVELMVPLMSVHEKEFELGSKRPTQLAFRGERTTMPLLATTAPTYLGLLEDRLPTHVKAFVEGRKTPTHVAIRGAKTIAPLGASTALLNLESRVMVELMSMQAKALVVAVTVSYTHLTLPTICSV